MNVKAFEGFPKRTNTLFSENAESSMTNIDIFLEYCCDRSITHCYPTTLTHLLGNSGKCFYFLYPIILLTVSKKKPSNILHINVLKMKKYNKKSSVN